MVDSTNRFRPSKRMNFETIATNKITTGPRHADCFTVAPSANVNPAARVRNITDRGRVATRAAINSDSPIVSKEAA